MFRPDWEKVVSLAAGDERKNARGHLPVVRAQSGLLVEAVAEIRVLMDEGGWNPDQWYLFARVCGWGGARIPIHSQEYAELSMQLLMKAKAALDERTDAEAVSYEIKGYR